MNGLKIEISVDDATFSSEGEFGNVSFNNINQLCGPDAAASLLSFPVERIHPLGQGSSSIVYKSLILNKLCVVAEKVFVIGDSKKKIQLFRELQSLKSICSQKSESETYAPGSCPFIVQLLEVFSNPQDGTLSLCLEYMDCGSLENVVQNGGCRDESVLSSITYQMLSGLQFLHEKRLIHRDVKPSNALISSDGRVKLADFGLARTLDNGQSLANSFVGTFLYMAPERLTGESYSFQSDIWSLGLAIHAVALGRFPYLGKSGYWEVLSATQQGPPPIQQEFSNALQEFLSLTYQLEVSKRPSAVMLLALPFTQAASESIPEHRRYVVCRNLDTTTTAAAESKTSSSLSPAAPAVPIPQIPIPSIAGRSAVSGQPQSAPCTATGNLTFRPRGSKALTTTTTAVISSASKGVVPSRITTARGQISSSARTLLTQNQHEYTGAGRSTASHTATLRSLSGRSAAAIASSNSARQLSSVKGQSGTKIISSAISTSGKTSSSTGKTPMTQSASTVSAISAASITASTAQRKNAKVTQEGRGVTGRANPLTSPRSSVKPWTRSVSATALNNDKNIDTIKGRHTQVSASEKIKIATPIAATQVPVAVRSARVIPPQQDLSPTQAEAAAESGEDTSVNSIDVQRLVQAWEKYVTLARQKQLHTEAACNANPARRLLGAPTKQAGVVAETEQPVESYDYVASPSTAVNSLRRLVSRQHASREMYVTEETIGRLARTLSCDVKILRSAFWAALERIDAAWQGHAVQRIAPGKVASLASSPFAAVSSDSVCSTADPVEHTFHMVASRASPQPTRAEIKKRSGDDESSRRYVSLARDPTCRVGGTSMQQQREEDDAVEEEYQEEDLLDELTVAAAGEAWSEGELDESIEEMLDRSILEDSNSREGDDQRATEEVSDEAEQEERNGIEEQHDHAPDDTKEVQRREEEEEDVYADEIFEDFTE